MMSANPVIETILAHKRAEVEAMRRRFPEEALRAIARERQGPRRSLIATLAAETPRFKVIAEVKRATPSKMLRSTGFDPVAVAEGYETSGAVGLSVLTDARFFAGAAEYAPLIREATGLPVLRKDFIIDRWQVAHTAALGADALLLMAVNFPNTQALEPLYRDALELGMEPLVEIHDWRDWELVRPLAPRLVGINNRDFRSADLAVDIHATLHLAPLLPEETLIVSESGVGTSAQMDLLRRGGADGFLIGSALMEKENPGAALAALLAG